MGEEHLGKHLRKLHEHPLVHVHNFDAHTKGNEEHFKVHAMKPKPLTHYHAHGFRDVDELLE